MCAMDSRPFSDMTETIDTSAIDTVLESVLSSYQLRVEITANVRYCGTWFDEDPATRFGQFHLVTEGDCWVSGSALTEPEHLLRGDLIVFPSGIRHSLSAMSDPQEQAPSEDTSTRSEEHTSELQSLLRNSYAVF